MTPVVELKKKNYNEAILVLKGLNILNRENTKIRSLSSISNEELSNFSGLFIPGGHAVMIDLYKSEKLGSVLNYFHKNRKPTALVCHGPVALLSSYVKGSKDD